MGTFSISRFEASNLEIEKVPIQVGPVAKVKIKREKDI
jgi:KUP system potassium uptake protein